MNLSSLVQYVPTRLGDLAVTVVGSGPPAVLWHGMFVDSLSWARIVPELSTRRQLLLIDGPAHGGSARLTRRSSIAECADVALEIIDALADGGPVDWVGNAWGGHVGMRVAATRGDRLRSLVAISSPPEAVSGAGTIAVLATVLDLFGPVRFLTDKIVEAQLTEASQADESIRRVVENALARTDRHSLARAVRSFIVHRPDATADLPSISVPALYLASDDRGEWTPEDAARAAAATPNARLAVIEKARTLAAVEQPAAVAEHILEFWRSTAPR